MEVELHSFLSSVKDGYKWSASRPRRSNQRMGGPQSISGLRRYTFPAPAGFRIQDLPECSLSHITNGVRRS